MPGVKDGIAALLSSRLFQAQNIACVSDAKLMEVYPSAI